MPTKKNTANVSLVQALLGIGGIFLACPLDKVGWGSDLTDPVGVGAIDGSFQSPCTNAVGVGAIDDPSKRS